MIEAYKIGVSLVLDQSKLLGPLNEAMKAFERIQDAVKKTQGAVDGMSAGMRGAASAASAFADHMERAARASSQAARSGSGSVMSGGGQLLLSGPGGGGAGMPPLELPPPGFNAGAAGSLLSRGMAALQVVEMVAGGIEHLIDKAKGLNDAIVVLQQRGLSAGQADGLETLAFDIARKTPGRDTSHILADAGNLRSILGQNDGADPLADVKSMLPAVERMAAALSAVTGQDSESSVHMLMSAVGLRGGLIDPDTHRISKDRFGSELEAIYRVLVAGGGMIKPADLLNLMQQAGPMARMDKDPDHFYSMMMSAILDMKGNRAGTSLSAAGRQLFGGRMSPAFAKEMAGLDLIPQGSYKSAGSGYITLNPEAQKKLTDAMQGGLFDWVQKVLRPALLSHGFETDASQNQELYKLFTTETFRRLAALFLQNEDQVLRDQKLIPQVPSSEKALDLASKGSIGFNMDAMFASVSNFLQSVEKANSGKIIEVLHAGQTLFDWLASSSEFQARLQKDAHQGVNEVQKFWPWQKEFWNNGDKGTVQKELYSPTGTSNAPLVHTITYIQLDGRTIAKAVSDQQARGMSMSPAGTSRFDGRMTPSSPGQLVST